MSDPHGIRAKLRMFLRRRIAIASAAIPLILLFVLHISPAAAQQLEQAIGVWADENGEAYIEIGPCGGDLCGRVVWLRVPDDRNGLPLTDVHNPDQSLRSRPMLGLVIMMGLRPDAGNSFIHGQVYNAKNGKLYDVYLTPRGQTMQVEGCLMKFLCASQIWTRVN